MENSPRSRLEGLREIKLFEDFLSLARLHRAYTQNFRAADLYSMDLIESREDADINRLMALWERYRSEMPGGKTSLYLATPFCFRKCGYCTFFKQVPSCAGDLEEYKDRLVALAGAFGPLLSRVEFQDLFFGGGTPSLFSERQLSEICKKVVSRLKISAGGSRTFECSPLTATGRKLAIAARAGFNRVSLGVQSLDPAVLKVINRDYQDYGMVRDFMRLAHKHGFAELNVDLMIGIRGDTPESFAESFRKVIALGPTTISVYQIVPNQEYLDRFHGGDKDDFFAWSLDFRKRTHKALVRIAEEYGFKPPRLGKFCMENKLTGSVVFKDRKAVMEHEYSINEVVPDDSYFTLGHMGNSYIPNLAFYQTTPLTGDPGRNVFKLTPLAGRRGMEYYCLRRLSSYNEIRRGDFRGLFKRDILSVFGKEARELRRAGFLKVYKDRLVFLKTDVKTRFLMALVFIGRRRIGDRLNYWLKERRIQLRFTEFCYEAYAVYGPGGRLSFHAAPLPGSKRSGLFEQMLDRILGGVKAGACLEETLMAFETALKGLQGSLRRRIGINPRQPSVTKSGRAKTRRRGGQKFIRL